MNELLELPIHQSLGFSLLHFVWQGSIVGILLFILLCVLHKPQQRYLVSCLALLTLALLPVVTFANLYEAPQQNTVPIQNNEVAEKPASPRQDFIEPAIPAPQPVTTEYILKQSRLTIYLPWFVLVWFVGALIFSGKLLLSFVALQRFRTKGVKLAEQSLQLKLLDFSRRLNIKQKITLLESKLVPVPVVLGWLRPVILLPTSAITGLAPKQLEMLLAHELAHVMRRDYLVNILQSVLESLLFYHPVVWWVSGQIRREREYCCDDIAVSLTGDSRSYAQTLLSLAEMRVSLAPAASGGVLFTRVSRLLQPLETDMRPSYFFAGLSSLGVLVALLLTVVNVSVAQEDKTELWVTVVGDVTFSDDYSDIESMAPDAFVMIEERDNLGVKKIEAKLFKLSSDSFETRLEGNSISTSGIISGDETVTIVDGSIITNNETLTADQIIVKTRDQLVIAYNYSTNGAKPSDEYTWYAQALKDSLIHFYPRESEDQIIGEKYEDKVNNRVIYFIAEETGRENTFSNMSTAHWETAPSQAELLENYREDIRYETQRYGAGLLKDRSFAGYLDGVTASPDFPAEVFPDALEATSDLKSNSLKEQLVKLIETRSKTPREDPLLFLSSEHSIEVMSSQITEKPSPDGKNRISGQVFMNEKPASFAVVSLSIPLDATVDPGLGIAQTGSNKQGEFTFTGFNIPSGEYIISVGKDNIFTNFVPFSINEQELEIRLDAVQTFNTLEPKPDATVSTTPTLSWESTPNAVRYLVTVYGDTMKELLVYQMTDATTLNLELPLEPKKTYSWSIGAYNKDGKLINAAYGDVFKTE